VNIEPTPALEFSRQVSREGRNRGPALLLEWLEDGLLDPSDLWRVIGEVWMWAEWPTQTIEVARWVELWRTVGFFTDIDEPAPTEPVTAYRGSSWGRRRGMSWTVDPSRAEWFAGRWVRHESHVFQVTIPAGAVLARLGDPDGRDEGELVVDPSLLPPVRRSNIVSTFPVAIR
jgi:hypothetical protein